MCGVRKSIAEWTSGRDKSLSIEPRREGGGGRGTKTATTASTTASATQHGRDRVEEVEGKRLIGATLFVCVGAFIPPQRLAQQKYTRWWMIGKEMQESPFFNEAAALYYGHAGMHRYPVRVQPSPKNQVSRASCEDPASRSLHLF